MAFCRFGTESDVYVYHSVNGYLECCMCSIQKRFEVYETTGWRSDTEKRIEKLLAGEIPRKKKVNFPPAKHILNFRKRKVGRVQTMTSFETKSYGKMIQHLENHIKHGDKVPSYTFRTLKEERKRNGNFVK